MGEPIRILLADDHAVIRNGLSRILGDESDIRIVGQATDGLQAIDEVEKHNPDVILMDIFMPGCSGLEATITIKQKFPNARVLILTVSDREEDLFQALRFGAQGYLLKSATATEVIDAIRKTAAGEAVLSPQMMTRLVAELQGKTERPKLSGRELQVLELLGEGLTNTQIADRLFISESSVRTYLRRLLDKLHLKNRAEAIIHSARTHPKTKRI